MLKEIAKKNLPFPIYNILRRIGGAFAEPKEDSMVKNMAKIIKQRYESKKSTSDTNIKSIFVDLGFNTRRVFNSYYDELGDGFYFYGFEIQKDLYDRAIRESGDYKKKPVKFLNCAAASFDDQIKYYEVTTWGKNLKGGSTTVMNKSTHNTDYSNPISVEAIDFSRWIKNNFDANDFIVVKMDIEGAEYDVLENLIENEIIEMINLLIVEFHWMKFDGVERENYHDRHVRLVEMLEKTSCEVFPWR